MHFFCRLRAYKIIDGPLGKNGPSSNQFVTNELNNIIYSNYQYANPLLGETNARPSNTFAPITREYVASKLALNLYAIFYPNSTMEAIPGYRNPWQAAWCPLPNCTSACYVD